MKRYEKVFKLNKGAVDEISDVITQELTKYNIRKKDIILLRLSMEDVLIRVMETAGENVEGTLIISRKMSVPAIIFRYKGECINPLEGYGEEVDVFSRTIISNEGFVPLWDFKNGVNEVSINGSPESKGNYSALEAAIAGGIILGALGGVIPNSVAEATGKYILDAAASSFMHILNSFVGIMVFISVLSGVCALGNIREFSKIGVYSITRMLKWTAAVTAIGAAILVPCFNLQSGVADRSDQIESVFELILSVFPSNPVTPFMENNLLQILMMSLIVGIGILLMEERIGSIRNTVSQINTLVMKIIGCICKFLPLYIFASITVLLWNYGLEVFVPIWRPFVIFLIFEFLLVAFKLVVMYRRFHISPIKVLSKIRGPMIIAFATASTAAALGETLDTNENNLGVSEWFSRFVTPMSSMFYRYHHSIMYMIIMLYLAEQAGVHVNMVWVLILILLSIITGVVSPPVAGGQLVIVTMMVTQLGIPESYVPIAGVTVMLMDFFATSLRMGCAQMEIVLQADKQGELDREILMS